MDQGMLSKVIALRDEAFAPFKALDDAVVALGGKSRLPSEGRAVEFASAVKDYVRRGSMAGAAELILREKGIPVTGSDLMAGLPAKGVTIGGENPTVNFTSSMSKSKRFQSIRRDGKYYWWLKDEPLPEGWNEEAPDLLSKEGSDASVIGNQKGGEAHAMAT